MNPDPRLYLSARRPGGQDDADPAMADALHHADRDPQLAAWAERERQIDAAIAEKLRAVAPPPGLRERIIAGGRFRRRNWFGWLTRPVWRNFHGFEVAAAAAIAMLLAVLIWQRPASAPDRRDVAGWQEAAAMEVAAIESDGSTGPLDHVVNDMPQIRAWLASQTCPSPATLPAQVRELTIFGCAKRSWRGQPLSIVCFSFDGDREVHLVTIDRKGLPAAPPSGKPTYATVRGYETASWSEGEVAMMLIGKVRREELQRLFAAANVNQFSRQLPLLASLR